MLEQQLFKIKNLGKRAKLAENGERNIGEPHLSESPTHTKAVGAHGQASNNQIQKSNTTDSVAAIPLTHNSRVSESFQLQVEKITSNIADSTDNVGKSQNESTANQVLMAT